MQHTVQQRAILDFVRDGAENLTVSATAGSGKTTTIVDACSVAGQNVGFLAFNKHIASELKSRLNDSADARTLNSLGLKFLKQHHPHSVKDEGKVRRTLKHLHPEFFDSRGFLRTEHSAIPAIVDICRQQAALPTSPGNREIVRRACSRQGVKIPPAGAARDSLFATAAVVTRAVVEDTTCWDFLDQLIMPLYHEWVTPIYKTLFIDELQDLSPIQQMLALASGERVVAIGDEFQSIMGFAGADIDAVPSMGRRLTARENGCDTLPLSCCFRCPASHVAIARILSPRIEPRPDAPDGVLADASVDDLLTHSDAGDFVLCRNTAPLISLAFRFIRSRKPFMVRGRDGFGDGLKTLVRKLGAATVDDLLPAIAKWLHGQTYRMDKDVSTTNEEREQVQDRADSLTVLARDSETVEEMLSTIDSLFADKDRRNVVCLSTVHRVKGLESDRVWLYEPGLMPSRPGERQELNILFVALTRSKSELYLVDHHVRRTLPTRKWVEAVANGAARWDVTVDKRRK